MYEITTNAIFYMIILFVFTFQLNVAPHSGDNILWNKLKY